MLAGAYRPRARLATDGNVATLVQGIVGDIIVGDVGPDPTRRPVG